MTNSDGFFLKYFFGIILVVFCLVTFLISCNSVGKKPTLDQLTEITVGVTTKDQAIQILGKPERQYLNRSADETIMSYNSGAFYLLIGSDGRVVKKVLDSGRELK